MARPYKIKFDDPRKPRPWPPAPKCDWHDPDTGECCIRWGVLGFGPPLQPRDTWWCVYHAPVLA